MAQYEYELLTLERTGHRPSDVHWVSDRCGGVADMCNLQHFLNKKGKQGWHIVSQVADPRFGNQIILQKELDEPEEKNQKRPAVELVFAKTKPEITPAAVEALEAKVDQLSSAMAQLISTDKTSAVVTALNVIHGQLISNQQATLHCTAEEMTQLRGQFVHELRELGSSMNTSLETSSTRVVKAIETPAQSPKKVTTWSQRVAQSLMALFTSRQQIPKFGIGT